MGTKWELTTSGEKRSTCGDGDGDGPKWGSERAASGIGPPTAGVQLRVTNVLKKWIHDYYWDFVPKPPNFSQVGTGPLPLEISRNPYCLQACARTRMRLRRI